MMGEHPTIYTRVYVSFKPRNLVSMESQASERRWIWPGESGFLSILTWFHIPWVCRAELSVWMVKVLVKVGGEASGYPSSAAGAQPCLVCISFCGELWCC